MRRLAVFAFVLLTGCGKSQAKPSGAGTFAVRGLDALEHKPLIVLGEVSAWMGSPDQLPTMTIYEDGLVLSVDADEKRRARVTSSRVAEPLKLVDAVANDLLTIDSEISIADATDQPWTSIFYRVGKTWRYITVHGFMNGTPSAAAGSNQPPAGFVRAYQSVRRVPATDAKPWSEPDYLVTLSDVGPPEPPLVDWPPNIAPPPAGLVPNPHSYGNARQYTTNGESGSSLYAFVRAQKGPPAARLPNGETYSVWVDKRVPSQRYIDAVYTCARSGTGFHECD